MLEIGVVDEVRFDALRARDFITVEKKIRQQRSKALTGRRERQGRVNWSEQEEASRPPSHALSGAH